ncbi:37S ribosomal protein S24, mitochondrial [Wickerhamomyces ciferrii]|uniref:Small ribosomal subunit protein mS35 n=1 Tax=Wickerhamomyces ciferrii (strain ATCC 14091 / BCRC 22168 / CBS 111 / JCM 3599 / NBRC 0793 / NRRL Y-1031 F-60-10) TaxID=1206466 RepID=K0KKE6_WICCF|nr:37S ribosomal protein S24, mitochondrial [Wickerhamomyces ciferrii]CCH43431.1 37S ribosomal protein S24, mitochondrial [Wickerhamomyces ciferrii]
MFGIGQRSIVRSFSTSSKILNSQKPLYKTPSKWLDLNAEQVFDLHLKRKYELSLNYRKSEIELQALKKHAKEYGYTPQQLEQIYWDGDLAHAEIDGLPLNSTKIFDQPLTLDEYPEPAQVKIKNHRERRKYNRIAAYEMPHLAKYRQEYQPPKNKPINLKYTSILGEEDLPINKKVVLTLKTEELGLNNEELHKFRLISGTRYDYRNDEFKMSSEKFPETLQNTRYLLDTLKTLISESKDPNADKFLDIPLDKRHIFAKERKRKNRIKEIRKVQFPEEWKRPEDAPKVEKTVLDYLYEKREAERLASYEK